MSVAARLPPRLRATGLLNRFISKETHAGRVTPPGFPVPEASASTSTRSIPNPFIPLLNPTTGKWRPARYSRRRQAELVKAARLLQVEPILPLGPKGQRKFGGIEPSRIPDMSGLTQKAAATPVEWVGVPPPLNEKGLYGSRRFMFKGHKWERQLPEREQSFYDFKVKYDQAKYVLLNTSTLPYALNSGCTNNFLELESKREHKSSSEEQSVRARREAFFNDRIRHMYNRTGLPIYNTNPHLPIYHSLLLLPVWVEQFHFELPSTRLAVEHLRLQ